MITILVPNWEEECVYNSLMMAAKDNKADLKARDDLQRAAVSFYLFLV